MRISDWSSDVCSNAVSLVLDSHFDRRMEPEPGYSAGIAFQYLQSPAALFMEQHVARHGNMARDDEGKAPKRVNILFDIADRKSVVKGKSVSVRVDLGGRRTCKKKKRNKK